MDCPDRCYVSECGSGVCLALRSTYAPTTAYSGTNDRHITGGRMHIYFWTSDLSCPLRFVSIVEKWWCVAPHFFACLFDICSAHFVKNNFFKVTSGQAPGQVKWHNLKKCVMPWWSDLGWPSVRVFKKKWKKMSQDMNKKNVGHALSLFRH